MKMFSHSIWPVAAAAAAAFALVACSPTIRPPDPDQSGQPNMPIVAIEHVAVVDVVQGQIVGPRTVLLANGRIAAIGRPGTVNVPSTAIHVDGRGRYLMPGLVDMHVHLFNNASHRPPNEWTFPLFIVNGVTAVREMNATPQQLQTIRQWRQAAERGELLAPRILAAGVAVDAPSLDAVGANVRQAQAAGAEFIKVFSETTEPHWRAIMDEARRIGIPVAGHVPAQVRLLADAVSGQRTSEHLMQAYEACSSKEDQYIASRTGLDGNSAVGLRDAQEQAVLDAFDDAACRRTANALAETGQVQVPTLVLAYYEAQGRQDFRDDPRWRYLRRPDEQARWVRILSDQPYDDMPLRTRRWQISRRIIAILHAAGVPILAGTDTPMPLVYPGYSLAKELELLVASGLTPADALRSATIDVAKFQGTDATDGSVDVGKRADLVLLDADPLTDIRNTQRIHAVVVGGRLLQRADLDALLDNAAGASKPTKRIGGN